MSSVTPVCQMRFLRFNGPTDGRCARLCAAAVLGVLGVAMLMPAPAQALLPGLNDGGIYAQAYVGANFGGEIEEDSSLGSFVLDRDTSVVGGGTIGYKFDFVPFLSLRTEVDGSYTPINVDAPGASVFDSTDADLFSALGNVWLDFEVPLLPFTPYVGGGVGLGLINFDGTDNTDMALAYQVGGGMLAFLPGTPFFLGLNYRYFVVDGEIDDVAIAQSGSNVTVLDVDAKLTDHRGTVSIGIQF